MHHYLSFGTVSTLGVCQDMPPQLGNTNLNRPLEPDMQVTFEGAPAPTFAGFTGAMGLDHLVMYDVPRWCVRSLVPSLGGEETLKCFVLGIGNKTLSVYK